MLNVEVLYYFYFATSEQAQSQAPFNIMNSAYLYFRTFDPDNEKTYIKLKHF